MSDNICHICSKPGFKSDGQSRVWCEKCHSKAMCPQVLRESPKVHRNDPCTCGSGSKFKKCCGLIKIVLMEDLVDDYVVEPVTEYPCSSCQGGGCPVCNGYGSIVY